MSQTPGFGGVADGEFEGIDVGEPLAIGGGSAEEVDVGARPDSLGDGLGARCYNQPEENEPHGESLSGRGWPLWECPCA